MWRQLCSINASYPCFCLGAINQPLQKNTYFCLKKSLHNDLNLKAFSTSVSRKAPGSAGKGQGQLGGVSGPGLRLGWAGPDRPLLPARGPSIPAPGALYPPPPAAAPGRALTGPGPHRAPAGLAASAPKGREAEALSSGATWRPRWQPAATGLFFGRRRGRSRVSAPLNGTYQALRGWVRVCYAFCGQPTRLRGVWGEGEAAGRAEWSSAGASLRLPLFSRAPSSSSVGRVNGSVPPSWPPP